MLQRGRKSAAALSVVTDFERVERLKPPVGLSEGEQALFRQVIAECAADHFTASDAPLLVAYVQSVLLSRWAFKELGEDRENYRVWQQAARTMATLATKLRLCPHSRTDPKTIARRAGGIGISAYDTMDWA